MYLKINQYPFFETISLKNKNIIDKFTQQYEPYSDFSFINMFCWNTEICALNDNLIIRLQDYNSNDNIISFIGQNKINETAEMLLADNKKINLLPEMVMNNINKKNIKLTEDLSNNDYIIDLKKISNLTGKSFKKKRNKFNKINFAYDGGYKLITTNTLSDKTLSEMKEVFQKWKLSSEREKYNELHEETAFNLFLDNANILSCLTSLLYINEYLVAFSVHQPLSNGWVICHFEKAIPVHSNIYTFLIRLTSKELVLRGFNKANWEQDLGLSGLTQAKSSFIPIDYLKKYSAVVQQ